MRIVILSGSIPTTTFIDTLVNTMAEQGFDMVVIGKKTGAYNYHSSVETIEVPETISSRLLFIIKLLLSIGFKHFGKILRAGKGFKQMFLNLVYYLPIMAAKPDKVHLQWTAFVHNRDLLFDLFPNKILVSLRGAHINYTPITTTPIKESYLRLLPKVDKFHAVSKAIVREAEQYGVSEDKTSVIYSCVSEELLKKEVQLRNNKDVLQIISVGRFFWKKGYTYAIDAMSLLKEQGVKFHYTIVAEGETPAEIKYQIHQLGLQDDIAIINGLPHNKTLQKIESSDVLLLPSVEEGIANVVLEAMALGTLVITTNVGGMPEVVQGGINGFVAPVRNAQAISDEVKKIVKLAAEERLVIAKVAQETIKQQHNKKDYTKQFVSFYKD